VADFATLGLTVDATGAITGVNRLIREIGKLAREAGVAERGLEQLAEKFTKRTPDRPVTYQNLVKVIRDLIAAQRDLGASMNRDVSRETAAYAEDYTRALRAQSEAAKAARRAQEQLGASMNRDVSRETAAYIEDNARALRAQAEAAKAARRAQEQLGAAVTRDINREVAAYAEDNARALRAQADAARAARRAQEQLGAELSRQKNVMQGGGGLYRAAQREDYQRSPEGRAATDKEAVESGKALARANALRAQSYREEKMALAGLTSEQIKNTEATRAQARAAAEASRSMNLLVGALAKVGLTLSIGQMIGVAKETLMLAARYETLGVVVGVVGRNLGKTRTEMDGYVEALQRGNITMVGSREELARMAAANLDIAQAAQISRVAQNAAVIAGINSSEAFERIITGITTQQPRVLRTLGIYVNFEAAQERYAKATGKRMEQLTAAERTQVNMNTALAGGAQVAGVYEAAMDTAGKQITSFVRYVQDLKTKVGEVFQPAFTVAVFSAARAFEWAGEHARGLGYVLGGVLTAALLSGTVALGAMIAASTIATAGLLAFGAAFIPISAAVAIVGSLASVWYKLFSGIPEKEAARKKTLDDMNDGVARYRRSLGFLAVDELKAAKALAQRAQVAAATQVIVAQDNLAVVSSDRNARPDEHQSKAERVARAREALAAANMLLADSSLRLGAAEEVLDTKSAEIAAASDKKTTGQKAYAKALRDANEELALQNRISALGTTQSVVAKREMEDAADLVKLNADVIEINERFAGFDTAKLVDIRKKTYEVTESNKAATRAQEDWLATLEVGTARWEQEQTTKETRAKLDDEEHQRQLGLADAYEDKMRAIQATLDAQKQDIGIASARSKTQEKELGYLKLLKEKTKEYLEATRVGAVAQPLVAKQLAEEFVNNQKAIDALASKTEAWKDALKDMLSIVQSLGRAFGEVGKRIAAAVTGAVQLYQILQKQAQAQAAATAAKMAAAANPKDAALGAASKAASSAATASTLSAGLGFFAAAGSVMGGYLSSVRASSAAAREAAQALKALGQAARARASEYAQTAQNASASPLESTLVDLRNEFAGIIKALVAAGGKNPFATGGRTAVTTKPTAQDFIDAYAAYEKLIAAAKRAAEFADKQAQQELSAREAAAAGNTALAEEIRQQIADEKELEDARLAGADATRLLRIATIQQAEADARRTKKAEEERRNIFDLDNDRLAFTDTRGANQAKFDESLYRRWNDAIARNASSTELAAIAAYNLAAAADYAAQLLEQDTRTREGLLARAMEASGDTQGASDAAFFAKQRQELADAVREGMSEGNLALLRFTQFAERSQREMLRAIEEGTAAINKQRDLDLAASQDIIDAIEETSAREIAALDKQIEDEKAMAVATARRFDEQIKSIRDATKAQLKAIDAQIKSAQEALQAAQDTVSALEEVVQTNEAVVKALTDFTQSLKLGDYSTLSPEKKLLEARSQFETMAAAAAGGDATAAQELPGAAQALLEASRAYNASNSGYVADYNRVQEVIAAITAQFGATLPIDQQQLETAKASLEAMQQSIDALNEQKTAIQEAAEAQIEALELQKDAAAEQSRATIEKLEKIREEVRDRAAEAIEKERERMEQINKRADDEIARLKLVEEEAHRQRVQSNDYWRTFLGLKPQGWTKVDGPTVQTSETAAAEEAEWRDAQLKETQRTNELLIEKLDVMAARLERLSTMTVVASESEVESVNRVESAVRNLTTVTRDVGQATAARINSRR